MVNTRPKAATAQGGGSKNKPSSNKAPKTQPVMTRVLSIERLDSGFTHRLSPRPAPRFCRIDARAARNAQRPTADPPRRIRATALLKNKARYRRDSRAKNY